MIIDVAADARGQIIDASVFAGSGYPAFDLAGLRAARASTYSGGHLHVLPKSTFVGNISSPQPSRRISESCDRRGLAKRGLRRGALRRRRDEDGLVCRGGFDRVLCGRCARDALAPNSARRTRANSERSGKPRTRRYSRTTSTALSQPSTVDATLIADTDRGWFAWNVAGVPLVSVTRMDQAGTWPVPYKAWSSRDLSVAIPGDVVVKHAWVTNGRATGRVDVQLGRARPRSLAAFRGLMPRRHTRTLAGDAAAGHCERSTRKCGTVCRKPTRRAVRHRYVR